MLTEFENVFKFALALFSILNPIGVLPIFLSLTDELTDDEISSVSTYCSLAVASTILISMVMGRGILDFFGISLPSFTIGGGILIFTMAFGMVSAKHSTAKITREEFRSSDMAKEIGVIPLAIPLLSGPGTISTAIISSQTFQTPYEWAGGVFVVLLVIPLIKIVLSFGRPIGRKLGKIGLNVMTRVMGLILLSLSIEMITKGLQKTLKLF